jgi:hypothetical protein
MSNLFNNTPVRVSLTKTQIEALIRQEVGKSFPNFVADQISFNASTQTDMRHEVSGTTFEGVEIVLKPSETRNSSYWDR